MNDYVSFAEFVEIFGDEVKRFTTLPSGLVTPQKHIEVCNWLEATEGQELRMVQAYREFAKSHLLTLYPVWRLYRDPDFTCVFVSATGKISSRNAYFVRQAIETHPLTKHLVPGNKELWQKMQFTVNRSMPSLEPSVACTSVTASKTGLHPDLCIVDDIEVVENCKTPEARELLVDCFNEMVNLSENMLFAGTPHDEQTLYIHLEDMGCNVLKIPFYDEEGKIQMPELHNEAWVDIRRSKLKTSIFESQYLLIPRAAYDVILDPDLCITHDEEIEVSEIPLRDQLHAGMPNLSINGEQIRDLRAYWDVAMGRHGNDDSVLAIIASTYDGNVYVIDLVDLPAVDASTAFDRQMKKVLEVCERNYCNTVFVEVNFSRTLAIELKRYAKANKKRIRVKEAQRTSRQNKLDYIGDALEPLIKVGRLYVHEHIWRDSKLKEQMRAFPDGRHDDFIDALAGAITEAKLVGVKYDKEKPLSDISVRGNPKPVMINA